MTTRSYDFVSGIESATAPTPGTPSADADLITKGYADDTYALRSSWMDKAADNTAVKAISAAERANGQIIFNYGTDKFYKFDSGSSATDDDDLVLQPASGTGRWLAITTGGGSSSGETIVQNLDTSASTAITSGEDIADRNAVCVELHNGSGSNVYRIFKCDEDLVPRRSFIGFASAAATGTTGSYTYTISAAYVASNSVPIVINGRTYTTTYASSSDATLQALATLIATDQDVTSAAVTVVGGNQTGTDDRVITIVPKGHLSLNITGTTVTGGASQPTITVANPTPAAGANVDITQFGPMSGFTSLTPGALYYLSGTAGAITSTPTNAVPVYVGKALTSTVLFVDASGVSQKWGSDGTFVRSHGSSAIAAASATKDVEMFNFTAWASGTADSTNERWSVGGSDGAYIGTHLVLDGGATGGSATLNFKSFNKSAWSTKTDRSTPKQMHCVGGYGGYYWSNFGLTGTRSYPNGTLTSERWNSSAWASATSFSVASKAFVGSFKINSLFNFVGGLNTAGAGLTNHETKNTSDTISSATVVPAAGYNNSGANQGSALGIFANIHTNGSDSTVSYSWNGSAWSSSLTATVTVNADICQASAFASTQNLYVQNGGSASSAVINSTMVHNGSAFSTGTSSSNSRSLPAASYV